MLILAKRILNKQYREGIQILLCFSKELLRPFIVFTVLWNIFQIDPFLFFYNYFFLELLE